jgi:carbamoyl-phosphate synthase large subunit
LRLLDESVRQVGLEPRMLATDITPVSAAFHATEAARLVPRYSDPACLDRLLDLCRDMAVGLIVPTIDPDLPFYATHRQRFEQIGTRVMVSAAETIDICNDKRRTHEWLMANGFPVVPQIDAQRLLSGDAIDGWTYPVFVKPRGGSSSVGARVVRDPQELRLAVSDDSYIAQRVARGNEYTVDVYVDRAGRCRSAVPRLRIETRGGEVNKGMTIRCREVEQTARRVAEALPGAWGVLNIQIFYHATSGELTVSEINPRFGGGYPLTHQAGAPMARWIVEEVTGRPLSGGGDEWTEGLVMLRYDDAIFVRAETAGLSPTGMVEAREVAATAASAARGG